MFKIARDTFRVVVFFSLKLLFLILDAIVPVATGNCSCYYKGTFLWDDPDQDQWSEITRIMMHLTNRWILARFALRSITIRVISWPGSFQRNAQSVNDTDWDNTFRFGFCQVVFLTNRADCFYNALYQAHFIFNSAVFPRKLKREQNMVKNTFLIAISRCTESAKKLSTLSPKILIQILQTVLYTSS